MKPTDDIEQGGTREATGRHTPVPDPRAVRFAARMSRRSRDTPWDSFMSILGAIILVAIVGALLVEHFTGAKW